MLNAPAFLPTILARLNMTGARSASRVTGTAVEVLPTSLAGHLTVPGMTTTGSREAGSPTRISPNSAGRRSSQ